MFERLFQNGGLTLERLQTLCEIGGAQGLAKAARGSESKQSQFSRQIKQLEAYFGVTLYDRKRKRLTKAGDHLLQLSQPFLKSLEKLHGDLSESTQSISIGAGHAVLDWVLAPRFPELGKAFPQVVWSVRNYDTREITARLLDSDLDFGILRKDACQTEHGLDCTGLGAMSFALFVPIALKGRKPVPVATLDGSGQFSTKFEEVSKAEMNSQVAVKIRCQSFLSVKALVQTGQVAGMLPLVAEQELGRQEFEVIKNEGFKKLTRHYVLAMNRKNIAMRDLVRVGDKLATLCRMK